MTVFNGSKEKKEFLLVASLFVLLWGYIIARAFIVFLSHDEIVTKWGYMISWNPFPYQGYIDANNHFVNSLLGGFFIRLFQSDSVVVVRLANILSFPLYFWSLYGFRSYFNRRINFYGLLIFLTCTEFIIEFFGMSRGYGISMAL
ncbi:MAG: hypothetical protein MI922_21300, partial [Bacteroidales bacterium]|nr:hypothetical protein [Bacteroidales bacterium]